MHHLMSGLFLTGFIVSSAGATLLFKLAADAAPWSHAQVWRFVCGNLAGAFAPLFLTLALRGTNANHIFAVGYGASFVVLQVAAMWLFREGLSPWQWTGVAAVAAGILLLQVR